MRSTGAMGYTAGAFDAARWARKYRLGVTKTQHVWACGHSSSCVMAGNHPEVIHHNARCVRCRHRS